jgi:hypothetical protein
MEAFEQRVQKALGTLSSSITQVHNVRLKQQQQWWQQQQQQQQAVKHIKIAVWQCCVSTA